MLIRMRLVKYGLDRSRAGFYGAKRNAWRLRCAVGLTGLHDERELLELCLQTFQGATDGLHTGGSFAGVLRGDAIASGSQKAADQIGRLPGIEAGFHQLFAQPSEVGVGEHFDMAFSYLRHASLPRATSAATRFVVRRCAQSLGYSFPG